MYDGLGCDSLNVCGTEIVLTHDKKFYVLPSSETAIIAEKIEDRVYESHMKQKVDTLARIISYKPKTISLHIHASCAYYELGIDKSIWILMLHKMWMTHYQLLFYKKRYIRKK